MRPKEEGQTEALLQSLRYYPVTFAVARLAGLFKRDYSNKGKILSIADTIIAAVAIHHDLPLITDNIKDFPMKQLQLHTFPQA
jgi:predicted nucleic acid-binding protein